MGLSIGSVRPLDRDHLARLKKLIDRYQPESFSEHLAWSSHNGTYYNDLLPLPYSEETLARIVEHIDEVQTTLGRQMLLENPSTYVQFAESTIPEVEFLTEISNRTGCGLLLGLFGCRRFAESVFELNASQAKVSWPSSGGAPVPCPPPE